MTAFEQFIQDELPVRPVLLQHDAISYDGDPNNPSAPPILQGSPSGTFYLRGEGTLYQKKTASPTSWDDLAGGGGGGLEVDILYSLEPLDFSVDYNDVNAVDPPAGKVFSSQQEIDDFLSAQSATNFKHIQPLWDALPVFVFHPITISIAAGNQRPLASAGNDAFDLTGKYLIQDGTITFTGAAPSTWTDVVAAQTVTSHQVLGSGVDRDPWVQVSGTPYPTDGSLKGLFAVLDTGQTCLIHDHDANTLYLVAKLEPAPTDGVTTVRVCRPSTVFQNSTDGSTRKSSSGCVNISNDAGTLTPVSFEHVWFQSFGATWHVHGSNDNATMRLTLCLFDIAEEFDSLGLTGGRSIQKSASRYTFLTDVGFRSRYGINDQSPLFFGDAGTIILVHCVMIAGRRTCYVNNDSFMNTYYCVFEDIGWQAYYDTNAFFYIENNGRWSTQYVSGFYEGKRTTFRAINHPGNAFRAAKCADPFNLGFTHGVWFEGFQKAVALLDDTDCDLSNAGTGGYPGWQNDGAGNADVGIEIVGGGRKCTLGPGCDVNGTVGDIRLEGVVASYTDLGPESDPLITNQLNIVSKD